MHKECKCGKPCWTILLRRENGLCECRLFDYLSIVYKYKSAENFAFSKSSLSGSIKYIINPTVILMLYNPSFYENWVAIRALQRETLKWHSCWKYVDIPVKLIYGVKYTLHPYTIFLIAFTAEPLKILRPPPYSFTVNH